MVKSKKTKGNEDSEFPEKPKPSKKRIWLYVDESILSWVYSQMKSKVYADESHCFERLIMEKIEQEKRGKQNGK